MANNKELDKQLLREMFNSIRNGELRNIKTQKLDDKGMVRVIEEYISKNVKGEMKNNED